MNSIKAVTESYNKALKTLVECLATAKENATSEQAPKMLDECKNVIETLIENLPNIEKAFEELNNKFEVEKNCKNDAYFFILESGNFYRYRHWHFKEKKSELQTTLEKFWANNLKAPKEKKGKK